MEIPGPSFDFLVLLQNLHSLIKNYFSFWVLFNLFSLPLTFFLACIRLTYDVLGSWMWSSITPFLAAVDRSGPETFSFEVGKYGTKALKKEGNWKEGFAIVDLD